MDSLSTFFPAPLATQASVDKLGETMFTYQDGVSFYQRVANTDTNIQAELAALTETLPLSNTPAPSDNSSHATTTDWLASANDTPDDSSGLDFFTAPSPSPSSSDTASVFLSDLQDSNIATVTELEPLAKRARVD